MLQYHGSLPFTSSPGGSSLHLLQFRLSHCTQCSWDSRISIFYDPQIQGLHTLLLNNANFVLVTAHCFIQYCSSIYLLKFTGYLCKLIFSFYKDAATCRRHSHLDGRIQWFLLSTFYCARPDAWYHAHFVLWPWFGHDVRFTISCFHDSCNTYYLACTSSILIHECSKVQAARCCSGSVRTDQTGLMIIMKQTRFENPADNERPMILDGSAFRYLLF